MFDGDWLCQLLQRITAAKAVLCGQLKANKARENRRISVAFAQRNETLRT